MFTIEHSKKAIEPRKENSKWIYSLHKKVSNLPDFYFLLLMVVLGNIITIIFSPIFDIFVDFESVGDTFVGVDPRNMMLNTVIIAPIFETLLQLLPIELVTLFYKRSLLKSINYIKMALFSSALFGIMHYPSYAVLGGPVLGIIKVSCTFFLGLVLAYTYLVYKIKRGRPYFATALLHMLLNLSFVVLPRLYDLIVIN